MSVPQEATLKKQLLEAAFDGEVELLTSLLAKAVGMVADDPVNWIWR